MPGSGRRCYGVKGFRVQGLEFRDILPNNGENHMDRNIAHELETGIASWFIGATGHMIMFFVGECLEVSSGKLVSEFIRCPI